MDNELSTLCNEVTHQVSEVYKLSKATLRQSAVLEVAQKIRDVRVKLARAKRTLTGEALVELEKEEGKLEKMNLDLAREILGIDLKALSKVKA